MEDSLEKITINIDTDTATFTNNKSEFYVDIIDDIKNCIYIKTLKTEIFVKNPYKFQSKYDNQQIDTFTHGSKIYMKLNTGDYDLDRHIVPAKELIPLTYGKKLSDDQRQFYNNQGILIEDSSPPSNDTILFQEGGLKRSILTKKPFNFYIQDEYNTVEKYYDLIEISNESIIEYGSDQYKVYQRELNGTSCGPNDTNTYKLNPILPELRRFNLQFFYKNEDGKHVPLDIDRNNSYTTTKGVFRINISFTVYFNRKKITRA